MMSEAAPGLMIIYGQKTEKYSLQPATLIVIIDGRMRFQPFAG
jgi:hypothetical protein